MYTHPRYFCKSISISIERDSVHTRRDLWRGHAAGNDWIIQNEMCKYSANIANIIFMGNLHAENRFSGEEMKRQTSRKTKLRI